MKEDITFQKATVKDKEIIFSWLAEPHVREFWDNTQEHKNDILNFIQGRIECSSYCDGKYVYWIARVNKQPYAMLMTIQETVIDDIGDLKLSHLSTSGNTYGLDYMIGNTNYLGKGYGAYTLARFIDFFKNKIDVKADTFLIDPEVGNTRARNVYEKAGFRHVGDFIMQENCSGSGKLHHLLVKDA